jgi:hypothetical protein
LRREVPIAISAIIGVILFAEYFFKLPSVSAWANELQNWGVVISAFALALAAANLIRIHVRRIGMGGRQSVHSAILVGGLAVTVLSGILIGQRTNPFTFVFNAIYTPLAAAFYSMTAFHLASASYRAFRAKNAQAAALLITGVLLMLGRAPIGEVIWKQFPSVANWIMSVMNLAGSRGIMITTSVGIIGVGLRVLTGLDRAHLGGAE